MKRKNRDQKGVRMQSFLLRARKFLAEGKTEEAMKMARDGMNYYSNRIIQSISPYSVSDAGFIVIALRHIANEVEKDNEGTKEFVEEFGKSLSYPTAIQREKVIRPNAK